MEELIPVIGIIAVFGAPVLIAWIVARVLQQRSSTRTEQLNKLLDKFSTADEFVAFAETEAGEELMEALTSGRRRSRSHVMVSMERGLIASMLGVACLLLAWLYMYEFILGGVLLLALGIGFLISAFVAGRMLREDGAQEPDNSPLREAVKE